MGCKYCFIINQGLCFPKRHEKKKKIYDFLDGEGALAAVTEFLCMGHDLLKPNALVLAFLMYR